MSGPLAAVRVVELEALGPVPHAAMQLSDLGAEVIRVVRPGQHLAADGQAPPLLRGRTTVTVDLKDPASRTSLLELIGQADVLLEGFRPGVAERLGIGPADCLAVNSRLIYARMTGWGQTGPLAQRAGHDINYIALTGVLHAIGTREQPLPPLSLVGNYGGGSMFLVTGILAALLHRVTTGAGNVLDVAMVDGICTLMQPILDLRGDGGWSDRRSDNLLDGGAPFYRTYECADGRHVAVGAIESQFYQQLLAGLGLDAASLPGQYDRTQWGTLSQAIAAAFLRHPVAHWVEVFGQVDACVTPVLTAAEATRHPHLRARGTLSVHADRIAAAPAPRFATGHDGELPSRAVPKTTSLESALRAWQDPPMRLPARTRYLRGRR